MDLDAVRVFCYFCGADSPITEVSPPVVNAGEEVLLRCSVQFGAPRNHSRFIAAHQFPHLTMTLDDAELSDSERQFTEGKPYAITRVSFVIRSSYWQGRF